MRLTAWCTCAAACPWTSRPSRRVRVGIARAPMLPCLFQRRALPVSVSHLTTQGLRAMQAKSSALVKTVRTQARRRALANSALGAQGSVASSRGGADGDGAEGEGAPHRVPPARFLPAAAPGAAAGYVAPFSPFPASRPNASMMAQVQRLFVSPQRARPRTSSSPCWRRRCSCRAYSSRRRRVRCTREQTLVGQTYSPCKVNVRPHNTSVKAGTAFSEVQIRRAQMLAPDLLAAPRRAQGLDARPSGACRVGDDDHGSDARGQGGRLGRLGAPVEPR